MVDGRDPRLTALESTLVYAPLMAASMRERLVQCKRQQWSLDEEAALCKLMTQDAVRVYAAASEKASEMRERGEVADLAKAQAVQSAAGAYLHVCIDKTASVCQAAHRVGSREGLVFDAVMAQQLVFATVKIIDTELQRIAPALERGGVNAREFSDRVAGLIDVNACPMDGSPRGTELTPDTIAEEVYGMDATVPYVPPGPSNARSA